MKSGFFCILKKEFSRFFRDRRLVLTTLVMPGLLIYLLYSLMGSGMGGLFGEGDENTEIVAYIEYMPDSLEDTFNQIGIKIDTAYHDVDTAIDALKKEKLDILILFDAHFDEYLAGYLEGEEENLPPPKIYYQSAAAKSHSAYMKVTAILTATEEQINPPVLDISETSFDLSSDADTSSQIYAMMMPLLLMMLLFSGCIAVAPDAIAGEKERGTISTLLVTPIKRTHLALGKIVSLAVIALLSAISSTIGILLSLPKLMGGQIDGIDFSMYGPIDVLWLLSIILSSVAVIISIVSVISAYAKSVKETASYTTPLLLLVAVLGVSSMFMPSDMPLVAYFVPLYNSVACLSDIFKGDYAMLEVAVSSISNFAVSGLFVYLLTRMFNNEKIMFNQ